MRALGRAVIVCVLMCASRVLLEVVITKGTFGMLLPMNKYIVIRTVQLEKIASDTTQVEMIPNGKSKIFLAPGQYFPVITHYGRYSPV